MQRQFYIDLANRGLRMPIGTHLVLHNHADRDSIPEDGQKLGRIVAETARKFQTPLAVPLMDLTLEKSALLAACGIPPAEIDSHHFHQAPSLDKDPPLNHRMLATCEAIRYIATQTPCVPVGMGIGPFSLMTKLVSDPITPVFLAGSGSTADDEPEIRLIEQALALAQRMVLRYLQAQIDAGAKAIIICEPAANKVYFSPNQLAQSYGIFDRYIMKPNRQVKELLAAHDVDLIFHDCGELLDGMIRRFVSLDPAILSLGSSRNLWEDAALVPKSTVLYGNLPTKRFYSDQLISREDVQRMTLDLTRRMRDVGHPHILGSECDVLSVPGCEHTIRDKVEAFMTAE